MLDKNIWMPFYVGDYLADTQHLSTEEHGAYMLLMMSYWMNRGPLPDDNKKLAAICRMSPQKWRKVKPVILEFFKVSSGKLIHNRIDKELKKTKEKREQASERGKKAAAARYQQSAGGKNSKSSDASSNASSIDQAMHQACLKQCSSNGSYSCSCNHQSNPYPEEELPDGLVDADTGEVIPFPGAGAQ